MRKMLIILASAAIAGAAPAAAAPQGGTGGEPHATTGDPQSGQSGDAKASDEKASDTDRQFVEQVGSGGKAEVEFGRLAEHKASSKDVKEFARHMVHDHTAANRKLTEAAEDAGIAPPSKLDSDQRQTMDRLEDMRGADFDKAYMSNQLEAHQRTAQLLEKQINSGQDKRLQKFASETLPVVQKHLQRAQEIQSKLNKQDDSESQGDDEGSRSNRREDSNRRNDDSYRHNDRSHRRYDEQ